MSEQPKLKKIIGLRNIVTDGKEWKYLLFYDVDNPTGNNLKYIHETMEVFKMSYIIYKTKHGIHVVGLTPLSIEKHALTFRTLHDYVPEYYSGQTLRLSRKEGENQELLFHNFEYPIIDNLLEIYSKRFFKDKHLSFFESFQKQLIIEPKWRLVFEKFWTSKV